MAELTSRAVGSLLGLAVCDAVGTTVEFQRPGSFPPLEDMIGGGKFSLLPGQVRSRCRGPRETNSVARTSELRTLENVPKSVTLHF